MNRRFVTIALAILVPGGLIALLGAAVVERLAESERGRALVAMARAWTAGLADRVSMTWAALSHSV